MATHTRRILDRATVAKLSDARERLHGLVARAEVDRASDDFTWARDLNTPDAAAAEESSRG